MPNPILQALSAQKQPQTLSNNPIQLLRQFNEFKKMMVGKDPQAIVNELLNSGKMTQEQFDTLKVQAQELAKLLRM